MIAHHESTLEQRFEIQLRELERVQYFFDQESELRDTDFVLRFKDGRSISLRIQENPENCSERNDWIQKIEESREILQKNPIPAWTIV
jgi:hypothetical protein